MSDTVTTPARRPLATIEQVWQEYGRWAAVSRSLKAQETRWRTRAALLGIGGAALAALSVHAEPKMMVAGVAVSSLLGTASAALIASATYLGQKTLGPEGERPWTRARSAAEALKREVWLALLRVPPYHTDEADKKLEARADEFLENTNVRALQLTAVSVPEKPLPRADGVGDYVSARVQEQIAWYQKRASDFVAAMTKWKRVSALLGGLASLSGVSFLANLGPSSWAPVLTTATAAVAAHLAAHRYQTLIPLYSDTERQLRFRLARWENLPPGERSAADEQDLVRDSEDIMARENESWRADWKTADAG